MTSAKNSAKQAPKIAGDSTSNGTRVPHVADHTNVNIGLTSEQRMGVVALLNRHLANAHVLYIKTRNYHWNVQSRRFIMLHEFFGDQYAQLEEAIDEYAERARQLGGIAIGTMSEFLQAATLKEEPGVVPDPQKMIATLLGDHESIIRALREDIDRTEEEFHDVGTSDFLTAKMEEHEKMAWMLRAHLVNEE